MFYLQAYNKKGYELIGSSNEVIVDDLKTLRGLKNRMKKWVKWGKNVSCVKVFLTSHDSFFRLDTEKTTPLVVLPVVDGVAQW